MSQAGAAGAEPLLGSARPTSPRLLLWVLASLVMVAHFRPLEGGLLEEWGLALAWKQAGLAGFLDHLPLVAGRPLHLVPAYIGLWISNGGVTGMYLVLTATALAQFCVAGWALRPVVGQPILRALVVAAIALHPLWPAGYLLRYLPAQVSVLLFLVWFGFAVRYVGRGGTARPVAGSAALLVGLLTYQALALVYVLAGVLLVVWALPAGRDGVWRGAVLVGVALGAVVADLVYNVVVVPRISLTAYEPSLGGHALDLPGSAQQAYATTLGQMHLLSVAAVLVAAASLRFLVAAFRRRGFAPGPRTAPIATSVPLAGAGLIGALTLPLAALTYASFPAHLRDLERVGLPASVWLSVLVAILAGRPVDAASSRSRRSWVSAVPAVVGLAGLTTWALVPWVEASRDQRALLDPLAAEVRALPTGVPLVLADSSGIYGDVYTLVPPYLSIAMSDMLDRPVDIQLCTPDGVTRHHPVAARFPLTTTPDCSQVLSRRTPERVLTVPTHRHGTVSLLILPRSLPKP